MKKQKLHSPWTDKAAGKIARLGLRAQEKFASVMNKLFATASSAKLKIIVIVFCAGWGGLSLYFIAAAVFGDDTVQNNYRVDAIKRPLVIAPAEEELNGPMVDAHTYEQIQAFKQSAIYDSTIRARPGLADSILLLEQIYQSQNK